MLCSWTRRRLSSKPAASQTGYRNREPQLLDKSGGSPSPSFRKEARRVREHLFPENIVLRSRRTHADRQMTKSRARDAMSSLGLYAPDPSLEGIWYQCRAAAQTTQVPHGDCALSQLRADIAAAQPLKQSLAGNRIFAPALGLHPRAGEAAQTLMWAPGSTGGHRRPSPCQQARQPSSCSFWSTFPPGLVVRHPSSNFPWSLRPAWRMRHRKRAAIHLCAMRILSPSFTTRTTLTRLVVASPTFGTRPMGFRCTAAPTDSGATGGSCATAFSGRV